MAGSTTNLGLTKPLYSEDADIDVINDNMDILDTAMAAVDSGLAIVSNNNTHGAITAGQYVYVRNHGSLAEGLYTANSAISANATLSSSNLTAVSSGALNKLNTRISQPAIKVADCDDATDPSKNYYCESNTAHAPTTGWHFIKALNKNGNFCTQIASSMNGLLGKMYYRTKTSSAFGSWQELIVANRKDLGSFTTVAALSTLLDTELASMNNGELRHITVTSTNTVEPFRSTYIYSGTIYKANGNNYSHCMLYSNASYAPVTGFRTATDGWRYDLLVPQSRIGELRFVEYSSTGSSQTRVKVTFASSSTVARRLLLFGGGSGNTSILAVIYWSSTLCFLSSHGTKTITVDSNDSTSFTLNVGTYSSGSFITDADCTVTRLT